MAKKNILLVCGSGASSGFMAKAIRGAAKERDLDWSVQARSDSVVEDYIDQIDLLLVGPHLAYMIDDLEEIAEPYDVTVAVIPKEPYGNLDGGAVCDFALGLLDED